MKDLISIIVPVYKVEKYLDRCVSSIVNQTYKNLEIILVDDGSPDNCPEMCDSWAKKDSRIKVIHKQNGGLSSARNIGLDLASGDYIGFVDSDDWIAEDMYEYMHDLASKHKADVVQVGYGNATSEKIRFIQESEKIAEYTDEEILKNFAIITTTTTGAYSVCRCLFWHNGIKNFRFREGKINEDIDFKFAVLQECSRYVESNLIKYYYFQDSTSTTRGGLKKQDFDLYDAADKLYELSKDSYVLEVRKMGIVKKARTAFSLLCKIAYYGIADNDISREIIIPKLLSEHRDNISILLCSQIPLSRKILAGMFYVNYEMTEFFIRIAKKIL